MFPRFALPRINRRFQVAESPRIAKRTVVLCCLLVMLGFGPTQASAQAKPEAAPEASATTSPSTSVASPSKSGSAQLTQQVEPGIVHIVPFGRNGSTGAVRAAIPIPAGTTLRYWGGPVISQVHVVAVFWGPNVNPAITTPGAIDQFLRDITNSRYYDLLTEYSTTGITGVGVPATSSNQSINRGVFDTAVTITPSLCATATSTTPCSLTDLQIQQELARQINAGVLPTPVTDAQGNPNSFYMIYFPPFVTISIGTDRSCVTFCAYHSNTDTPVTPRLVPYGVLPDFAPPSGCSTGCGAGSLFQNVTAVTSHELSEAVTDALAGSATTTAPPLAWYDPDLVPGSTTAQLGEIGDICVGLDTPVLAGANSYTVQEEFSNLQGQCVSAPPNFTITVPPAVAPASPFSLTLSITGSFGSVPATFAYLGTVHFTSSDLTAVLPADYTFTSTDAGTHTFTSVALSTLGDQTITITDVRSSGFTGSATTNVNTNADMVVTKTHVGNFTQGQTGTYTILVSNNGQGPTVGTVTAVDTLPAGLTAASLGGTGWTCDLPSVTCTRADALPRNASYPPITLVVNVDINAATSVINTVRVSGGGETNTANDTASDPTTILPAPKPDLIVNKTHQGPIFGNFFQGETGATYTITVANIGNLASSGTVTVVDVLPGGLTATAIGGTGWNCVLATLACTRADSLGASPATYPPITLTVDVALNAASTVVNTATVSGGGDTNTGNNVAQDPTTIVPPPSPDMAVFESHAGNFLQGLTGTYDIIATNVGTGSTTAPVTVVDKLPAGLTATSMSGTGWTCDLATVTCTRSDTLPFNTPYPDILLTVSVANNATSGTNTVTVSGGGETNLANDTVSDPTTILPQVVDFAISIAHPSGPFIQGQVGATYFVNVVNNGTIASNGTVTVTNSLPSSLTPTAIAGPGWTCTLSTLTCTRSDPLPPPSVYPEIIVTVNVAGNAPGTLTVNANISGGGDSNPTNNTVADTSPVTSAVNIVPSGGTSATVTAGQAATFGFLAVVQSTAGTASFTCSGLPTGASCSFNPPTASLVGIPVTLTVNTTARTAAAVLPRSGAPIGAAFLAVLSLICMLLYCGSRQKSLRWAFAFAVVLSTVMLGCGGGGSGTTPTPTPPPVVQNPNGTPAGTYSITVSTSGTTAGSASQVFTLTVK
jgi:uncharacterized repeat protein (TIGR01451 family)